jgi:hypothetical protein
MKLSKLLTIAFLLAGLVLAGCGGGGGDTTEATPEVTTEAAKLSQEELISQGDAICAETNAAVGSVGSSAADTPTQITQTANLYVNMVENLEELGTPEDPAGYSDFIEAAEELAKVEGELKLAAEREDTAALGEIATEAAPILEEFQSQAAIYGFEDCSEGPQAPTASGPGSGVGGEEAEEGGVEVAPEIEEEVLPEEAPEEVAPETGGAGGGVEEAPEEAPETGGGSESGGVGPG